MPGYGYPIDKLQASDLFIGTPIYIINQTKDKRWSLVITPDFIVWVESEGVAYLVNQKGSYLATSLYWHVVSST